MQPIKIDFCETNVQYRSRITFETLRQQDGLLVRAWGCLGNCERCEEGPYAFVGDAYVQADTDAALLHNVIEALKAQGRQTPPASL